MDTPEPINLPTLGVENYEGWCRADLIDTGQLETLIAIGINHVPRKG